MNIEKLISCVQLRTPLWDQKSKQYHNRIVIKKLWEEVAKEIGDTSSAVKGRWRSLRDNFRKELYKSQTTRSGDPGSQKKSKWAYYENLRFLSDILSPRSMSGNMTTCNEVEDGDMDDICNKFPERDETAEEDEIEIFDIPNSPSFDENVINTKKTNPTKKNIQEQLLHLEQKKFETISKLTAHNNDGDYHFLMSLLPSMKRLTPIKNMQMRLNIQKLFLNEQMNTQDSSSEDFNTECVTVTSQHDVAQFLHNYK